MSPRRSRYIKVKPCQGATPTNLRRGRREWAVWARHTIAVLRRVLDLLDKLELENARALMLSSKVNMSSRLYSIILKINAQYYYFKNILFSIKLTIYSPTTLVVQVVVVGQSSQL